MNKLILSTLLLASSASALTLSSPDAKQGSTLALEQVFGGFGCTGQNLSPALNWTGVPTGTKSFALTVYDPDAPTGSGFWHWVVYNIPGSTVNLPKNAGNPSSNLMPAGAVQNNTDFGMPGYGGPCPPAGDKPHRYRFTLYALDVDKLELPPTATAAFVGFNLNGHILAKARFTSLYGR